MNATQTAAYAVRVREHLDDHWSDWFGGFTITRQDDGTSTLTGNVADQAQLHGVLSGLRDIGVELLELRTVDLQQPQCALPHPLRTERLTPARRHARRRRTHLGFRRDDQSVNEWLTGCPRHFGGYRDLSPARPPGYLTVVVELHDAQLSDDFMLRRHDAWSQTEVAAQACGQQVVLAGSSTPRTPDAAMRPNDSVSYPLLLRRPPRASSHAAALSPTRPRAAHGTVGMRCEAHTRRDALAPSGSGSTPSPTPCSLRSAQ
jgi:hypothetical protein